MSCSSPRQKRPKRPERPTKWARRGISKAHPEKPLVCEIRQERQFVEGKNLAQAEVETARRCKIKHKIKEMLKTSLIKVFKGTHLIFAKTVYFVSVFKLSLKIFFKEIQKQWIETENQSCLSRYKLKISFKFGVDLWRKKFSSFPSCDNRIWCEMQPDKLNCMLRCPHSGNTFKFQSQKLNQDFLLEM